MQTENNDEIDTTAEARRQIEICNACRYCEGYCSVFPAINRVRSFADGDITQLANLCHNCRGCYYACQYSEPHEFAVNLPKILAEKRQESWEDHAFPSSFGRLFHKSGLAIAIITTLGFALLFLIAKSIGTNADGEGFYAVLSHNMMVAIFAPAFVFPLLSIAISLRKYWKHVGGGSIQKSDILSAFHSAATNKNLAGGHGEGCNFEDEDRFSKSRRSYHHLTMYGFLLCFAATSVATIMHYIFNMPAPYALISLPKILGVLGGILLSIGTSGLLMLKFKADRKLSDVRIWGGEVGFVFLLFFVSTSGLALYWLGSSNALSILLAVHLGSVLSFFLLTPFSKMAHGFYRLTALIKDEQIKRLANKSA